MTNSQLTDLRTLILSEVGDFFAVVGSPGEPETPEEMQRELSMRLGRILNNHIVNYPRCEVLVEILRECRTARDEAQAELQERRKPLLDKDLQGVIGALEHPAGINAAGKQVVRSALVELQERRKVDEPELNPANLANKFYERYPLATFKSDSERAEAFGYFMAGAELQCFGEFIKYEDLCGDE